MQKLSEEDTAECRNKGAFCSDCGKCFWSAHGLQYHKERAPNCTNGHTASGPGLLLHCCICDGIFSTETRLKAHLNIHGKCPRSHFCEICEVKVYSKANLEKHRRTPKHIAACKDLKAFCDVCNISFKSPEAYASHFALFHDPRRATEFLCCDCNASFQTEMQLNAHLFTHDLRENSKKLSCETCGKVFLRKKHREDHVRKCAAEMKARLLTESKKIACLGGSGCSRKFGTPSAMVMHLESGACKSKINRRTINELVRKYDVNRGITMHEAPPPAPLQPSQLVLALQAAQQSSTTDRVYANTECESDSESEPESVIIYTPSSSSSGDIPILTPITTPVRTSFKHQCAVCLKNFKSAMALEMHIQSPVHDSIAYHCPLNFMGIGTAKDEKSFKTLSGLIQHLEYGACKGGMETFEKVMALVDGMARTFGFKLGLLTSG